MNMELRHLRYFTALATELNFGRAAARVNITQPPFSRQIKELEYELQATLFYRDTKTVKLTEPGRIFLSYVSQAFELLDTGIKTTRRAERGYFGRLAIGYTGTALSRLLPAVLRQFRKKHLDVELVLHEMVPPEQLAALEKGTIDIGFMRPETAVPSFRSEVLWREPLVLALPTDHPLAKGDAIDVRRLKSEGFIMLPPREGGLYQQIIKLCRRGGFEPRIVQVATQLRSIVGLVSAGIGISIVPSSARRNIAHVAYRKLHSATAHTDLAIVCRADDEAPVLMQFLAAARQATKALKNGEQ
jgi:DNA-binding transcriptional LysR family regulator